MVYVITQENLNILRDTAHLQTQLRIYDGLVETRYTLLKIRPQLRQNWVALAVAHHLNGNLEETKKTLQNYEAMLKVSFIPINLLSSVTHSKSGIQNVPDYDVEHSETLLYQVRVLEDLGEYADALSLLDTSAKSRAIVDRTAIMEYRGPFTVHASSPESNIKEFS